MRDGQSQKSLEAKSLDEVYYNTIKILILKGIVGLVKTTGIFHLDDATQYITLTVGYKKNSTHLCNECLQWLYR